MKDVHWVQPHRALAEGASAPYLVRIRYRQALVPAELRAADGGTWIEFSQPMKSVAPGQFAAWYDGDELIGSGVINN
jgi:tRNA-specific 2-thiouridylase